MTANNLQHFNVIVIGGGAVGLAAADAAAQRGQAVCVLEQFDLLHESASSGGAERQWRLQYAEEDLARLTIESERLWTELEYRGNRRLVHRTGSLWFGDTTASNNEGQITAAAKVLDKVGLPYRWLNAREIERTYRFAHLPSHYEGFVQPDGGMTDVRGTLWLLLEQARVAGVSVRGSDRVLDLAPDDDGVTVTSEQSCYRADHVVVAAGAFTGGLLRPLGIELDVRIYEMATAYFRCMDEDFDYPTWFVFQQPTGDDSNLFYGFGRRPWAAGNLVKVAPDFELNELEDPSHAAGSADAYQISRTAEWVTEHLPALDPAPTDVSSCLISLPQDSHRQFYLGLLPGHERIAVYSSGWGFKFVPLLGRACIQLLLDKRTEFDVARFGIV
jgi:sarcosine oxidase